MKLLFEDARLTLCRMPPTLTRQPAMVGLPTSNQLRIEAEEEGMKKSMYLKDFKKVSAIMRYNIVFAQVEACNSSPQSTTQNKGG